LRTSTNPIKATKFYAFLRRTLGIYLKRSFMIHITNKSLFSPPYILVGNHINNFDPFIMAYGISHPVNYVASDAYFRNFLLRFLLNRLGTIPKTKFLSDVTTAKAMINVKKKDGIVGVFPEGARSWDGHILPLVYSTAKLIKLLKIDVVAASLRGAMFVKPRWSRYRKKGNTYLSYEKIIDAAEISNMSVSDIYDRMSRLLYYDEYEFQRIHMNRYTGKRRAERLERFLYVCPSCLGFHTMKSEKNDFFCTACGYRVVYDEYGFFQGDDLVFDDTRKWSLFQQEQTKKMTRGEFKFEANKVLMHTGSREFKRLQRFKIGSLHLSDDSFYFQNIRRQRFMFDIKKISGLNIQSNYKLEFYITDALYRFNLSKSNICAYSIKKILSEMKIKIGGENG